MLSINVIKGKKYHKLDFSLTFFQSQSTGLGSD